MTGGSLSRQCNREKHKEEQRTRSRDWYERNREKAIAFNNAHQRKRRSMGSTVCRILKNHHLKLIDDPERLTTEFMQSLIGIECKK